MDNECTITRPFTQNKSFSLLKDMIVERGTKEDYEALHHLHYKDERVPPAPIYWRCMLGDQLVGIVVTSSCGLLLASRHVMLPNLKPGGDTGITNRYRPAWINKNLRRASRIITSTMYRGVGVSYRMVNLAMRMEGKRYVEILSSMSKFNPFDEKSGFKRAPLTRAAAYEKGLKFFCTHFDVHPSDHQAVMEAFEAEPKSYQKFLHKELAEFYYRHSAKEKTGQNLHKGSDHVHKYETSRIVKELQQLVFSTPVYGLYENPDFGHKLPESLPLLSYDHQEVNDPMEIEK